MSNTVNTTVGGVPVTISPAIPVGSGPSGQPAQIQSNEGSGISKPVMVNFAEPVKEFSVDVVGPSYPGNYVIAYDADGNEIARVPVIQLYNPWGADGSTNVSITAPDGKAISRVSLVPAPADYVAYNNIRTGTPVIEIVDRPPPDIPIEYEPEPEPQPQPQPVEPPVSGLWYEERFVGSPSVNGTPSLSRLSQILSTVPISARNIPNIEYVGDVSTLAPPMTVRWSRTDNFAAGTLKFNGSTDDGMLIRVNGTTVVEQFRDQPPTPFTGEVQIAAGRVSIEVIYYNDRGPGTAVVNYQLVQNTGVIQNPPVQPPPTPLPPPTPAPLPPLPQRPAALRLEDIIQFSQLSTDRFYVKDSMESIATETFIVRNVSDQYDVWLEIAEVEGIVPSPRSFLLERNSTREVNITFDVVQMNKYPEGVSRITLPIRFTSKVIIVAPEYRLPPTPPPALPPVLPPPPVFTAPVPPQYIPLPPPTVPTQIPTYEPPSYIPPPLIVTVPQTPFTPVLPPPPPPRVTPTEPQGIWVSGYEGGIRYGQPPAGWVLDPYGGCWYRPDDPFVLSGFGRNPEPTPQIEWIPVTPNTPVLKQESAPTGVWVSGYEGGLKYGTPPAGWVQDPFGGTWYSPDDPFVLSGFGRGTAPNIPVEEIQPPDTALPVPAPTPVLQAGVGGGGSVDFTDMDTFTPSSDLIQAI